MATLADSLVSSSARKLAMRVRPDLVFERHRYQGRVSYVAKDPVGLKYFRFQAGEFFILQMLDGDASLDDIKAAFEAEFPPEKISVEELQQFIGSLHRSGLILAGVAGQGAQLKKRRDERRRKEIWAAASNILSIRLKGIDPERLLNWLYPKVKFLYTRWAVMAWFALVLSAASLVAVQFDVFQGKLPGFHQFFSVQNAWLLAVALAVTKVLHEFGHGMTCKHYGGECHEMGVLVLVLTPCLYCNVSDSWMLPNKWHRAMIGAGGMYVELAIASVCTFVWWFTEPGLLNYLCLSTMFVCSVSTIIFNANPLLRYDGYYILSDVMEIPNLRQKSTDILNRKLSQWCLGIEPQHDPFLPQRNQIFFAAYTVASAAYRWVVTFSILWFLYEVFRPYRLEIIGQAIGAMALYGLFVQPIYKMGKFFWQPGRTDKVKKPRLYATIAVAAAIVALFLWLPLPYNIACSFEVKLRQPESVYVEAPGTLVEVFVKPGDQVAVGQPLAKLQNLDLDRTIEELKGQREQFKAQLENLQRARFRDDVAGMQVNQVVESLAGVKQQLAKKELDRERLNLLSAANGTVFPPPETPEKKLPEGELPVWTGTPMKPENLGCMLPETTQFCQIGNPEHLEALLVIDQNDVEAVRTGQKVRLQLDQLPGTILRSAIAEVARDPLDVSPRHLSNKAGGELATKTDDSGIERPLSISYGASAPIDDPEGMLKLGLRGRAKIDAGYRTVAQRAWRYITRTFNFEL